MIRNVRDANRRCQKKARRSRAWLNGVEVTDRCYYADDKRGVVRLFKVNADGHKYVARHELNFMPIVAVEELHGRVVIGRA